MILQKGAPSDTESTLPRERRVYRLLDELAIPYERLDHEAAETMEVCREIDGSLGALICKNLFLCNRQGTAYYLLMMPADKPFRTKELSAQINSSRLSFASPERMLEYLDILPGSVSVMGLMNDREGRVRLLIDEEVLQNEYVGCHPCVNTSSLRLRTADLTARFLPAVEHSYQTVHLDGGAGE